MDLLHLVCKFVKVNLTVIVRMVLPEYIDPLTAGISRHSRPDFVLKFSPKISPVAYELTLSNPCLPRKSKHASHIRDCVGYL